jgi:hypothetical protein
MLLAASLSFTLLGRPGYGTFKIWICYFQEE